MILRKRRAYKEKSQKKSQEESLGKKKMCLHRGATGQGGGSAECNATDEPWWNGLGNLAPGWERSREVLFDAEKRGTQKNIFSRR
jgi:hypothetical protein